MVNHFLVEDEKLLDRLIELVKDSAYYDGELDDDGYGEVEFSSSNNKKINEIKNEIIRRITK